MNPQFFVQIPRTTASSSKCHVVVSVTQHYETRDGVYRAKHKRLGTATSVNRSMHAIGFAVYEVPPNVTRLTSHFVAEHVSSFALSLLFKAHQRMGILVKRFVDSFGSCLTRLGTSCK